MCLVNVKLKHLRKSVLFAVFVIYVNLWTASIAPKSS